MLVRKALSLATVSIFAIAPAAIAEDIQDLKQLLSTKQCAQCDLAGSGLALAQLAGADLRGANLAGANLSRANLAGADLSGANLAGTSLYAANLQGANLTNANLAGTDLRESYLHGAQFEGTNLQSAYYQGAQGLPTEVATPELLYQWGVLEAQEGNFERSMAYLNRAIAAKPHFATAYFVRSIVRQRAGNEEGAIADTQTAAELYLAQGNTEGYQIAQTFGDRLQRIEELRAEAQPGSGNSFIDQVGRFIGAAGGLLLQIFGPSF